MRRIAFVDLIALGFAVAEAQIPREDQTLIRLDGLDPARKTYVVEVDTEAGTPTILAEIPIDDEGRGRLVLEGRLDFQAVTIRPAPRP